MEKHALLRWCIAFNIRLEVWKIKPRMELIIVTYFCLISKVHSPPHCWSSVPLADQCLTRLKNTKTHEKMIKAVKIIKGVTYEGTDKFVFLSSKNIFE